MNISASSTRSTNKSAKAPKIRSGQNILGNSGVYSLGNIVYPYPSGSSHFPVNHQCNNYSEHSWNQQYQNPMLTYGNQGYGQQYSYYHQQTPSPIISELARQYVTETNDAQYANQLLDPYRNSTPDPYLIHNYL